MLADVPGKDFTWRGGRPPGGDQHSKGLEAGLLRVASGKIGKVGRLELTGQGEMGSAVSLSSIAAVSLPLLRAGEEGYWEKEETGGLGASFYEQEGSTLKGTGERRKKGVSSGTGSLN